MFTLEVKKRDQKANLDAMRKSGFVPAVFYGKKEASTAVAVKNVDFLKVWKQAGSSSVIGLSGDGIEVEALIQDVDLHPVTGKPRHADFYVFEKGKKIKVNVPLEFSGVSPAVKDLGGSLVKVLHTLEIEAMPKDLPHNLVVDISALIDFKSVIAAKDIKLPSGVMLIAHADEVVASVYEPKEEIEEVAPTVDLSTIEVAKKGKEAKEGAEGEAAEAPAEGDKKADKKADKK